MQFELMMGDGILSKIKNNWEKYRVKISETNNDIAELKAADRHFRNGPTMKSAAALFYEVR